MGNKANKMDHELPQIKACKTVAKSSLFAIESLQLKFSNGVERTYERMKSSGRGAVMIVPINHNNELILVREYSAGTHSYQLGFPKGLIDPGEDAEYAANRELMEEVGQAAKNFLPLKKVSLAPGYFNAQMDIFIASDLYEKSLPGDEPEPLEVVTWPVTDWQALLTHPDFSEARSVAALMLARAHLNKELDEL